MASAATQPTVTWGQLQASPEWKSLSAPRKVWVTAFLTNGEDALTATRYAYPTASEESIRCMSYSLRKTPVISATIDLFHGGVTREVLISEVREAIRKAEPGSVAHQKLLAQLERLVIGINMGRRPGEPNDEEPATQTTPVVESVEPSSTPRCGIGDIVLVDGVKHRVTAVDANGKPTEGEPL